MKNEKYNLRYTPLSYEDLDQIDDYITNVLLNPQAALKLFDEVEIAINRLQDFPFLGSPSEDIYLAAKGYRKIVVANYIIFYLVDEVHKTVFIMRIIYAAREYRNLL